MLKIKFKIQKILKLFEGIKRQIFWILFILLLLENE
jgi:hypothetical protein